MTFYINQRRRRGLFPPFKADDVMTVEPTKVHLVSYIYIIQVNVREYRKGNTKMDKP